MKNKLIEFYDCILSKLNLKRIGYKAQLDLVEDALEEGDLDLARIYLKLLKTIVRGSDDEVIRLEASINNLEALAEDVDLDDEIDEIEESQLVFNTLGNDFLIEDAIKKGIAQAKEAEEKYLGNEFTFEFTEKDNSNIQQLTEALGLSAGAVIQLSIKYFSYLVKSQSELYIKGAEKAFSIERKIKNTHKLNLSVLTLNCIESLNEVSGNDGQEYTNLYACRGLQLLADSLIPSEDE